MSPVTSVANTDASDIYRVDEVLARTFNMLFVNVGKSGLTLVIISVTTPAFIALIIPLGAMYMWIQKYYLRTSRELKRLDSVSRSPIYAHFQETLGGVPTIRAYRQQDRFELENEWRVDANLQAYFPSISANRWLAIRLEFIGSVVILSAASFIIVSVAGGDGPTSGMVGLAMSYALQIVTSLNWIVRQTVEVETNIVSVERVLEYARLPSEAPEIVPSNRPPVSWPSKGAVSFRGYSTRYREGLDLVLKNINIDIGSHEKIGVVGRTGAGKSSLTLALFRIIEAASGNIDIDGIDTSGIGLLDLRRRLAIIPQDAALFEGTVRDNLDPGHVHDDTELWSVLGKLHIAPPTHAHPNRTGRGTASPLSWHGTRPCVCPAGMVTGMRVGRESPVAAFFFPSRSSFLTREIHGQHSFHATREQFSPSNKKRPLTSSFTEHARLKDHVSSMEGGLEAKVNEGGKQQHFLFRLCTLAKFPSPSHSTWFTRPPRSSLTASSVALVPKTKDCPTVARS